VPVAAAGRALNGLAPSGVLVCIYLLMTGNDRAVSERRSRTFVDVLSRQGPHGQEGNSIVSYSIQTLLRPRAYVAAHTAGDVELREL
jgi:hypothetical protein